MLSEDKTRLFVFDENDTTIFDGLVIDAPNKIFTYGDFFTKVSFANLDIPENIVSRQNFFLFEEQIDKVERGNNECML